MILIAHRGNTNGPKPEKENSPEYIQQALDKGYHVEIDVWLINKELFLGHDHPDYKITIDFLKNEKLWCHAKNFEALHLMNQTPDIHYFTHDKDPYTITSKGIIWAHPNQTLSNKTICVMPEMYNTYPNLSNVLGICSDFIEYY